MSLPFRTYTESLTLIDHFIGSKVPSTVVGAFYNLAYRQILESYEWSARRAELVINTRTPYTTGTVDMTQDSTAVAGTTTVWTASHTGWFLRVGSGTISYQFTQTGAGTGTIETAWPGDSVTDQTYELFQYRYAVDSSAGEVGQILLPNEEWALDLRDARWVESRDPYRIEVGSPVACILHGVDSDGAQLIEFWPRPATATSFRIPYYRRVDDLSGSEKPLIRCDLVEALALQWCYGRLSSQFNDPNYPREREFWGGVFTKLFEAATREDLERHGLPRSVPEAALPQFGSDFYATHDLP